MSIKTKLLLVDDEEAFVQVMKDRLSARDLDVSTALSGPAALQRLAESADVDVVLLDVKMPGMDGIETLREIKSRYPLVEVIMLTGYATVESAIQGMKLGAFDYLTKPTDMDLLMVKLQEARARKTQQEGKILEALGKELRRRRGR